MSEGVRFPRGQDPCARPSPGAHVQDPRQGPLCTTQARGPCAGPMLASQGPMCRTHACKPGAHVQAVAAMLLLLLLLPSRNKGLGQFFDPMMNHDISIPMMNHDIPISMMTKRPSLGDVALLHDGAAAAAARSFWIRASSSWSSRFSCDAMTRSQKLSQKLPRRGFI